MDCYQNLLKVVLTSMRRPCAKAKEISTFVSVAFHTKADVLTCTNDYFYGNDAPGRDRTPTGRWHGGPFFVQHVSTPCAPQLSIN